MGMHNRCENEMIAQSRCCCITRCVDCRTYQLHVGPVSLRLKAEAFEEFCETIAELYSRQATHPVSGKTGLRSH